MPLQRLSSAPAGCSGVVPQPSLTPGVLQRRALVRLGGTLPGSKHAREDLRPAARIHSHLTNDLHFPFVSVAHLDLSVDMFVFHVSS